MRRIETRVKRRWMVILMAALLAFAAGCASKNVPVEETSDMSDSEFSDGSDDASRMDPRDTGIRASDIGMSPVYFALDSSAIQSEYNAGLQAGANAIKASGANVVIEGHCDERGSEEYNFALGERRASAVRKYLYNLGVPMSQMSIVSYGETQPAVTGTGESVWRLNRRAEFKAR